MNDDYYQCNISSLSEKELEELERIIESVRKKNKDLKEAKKKINNQISDIPKEELEPLCISAKALLLGEEIDIDISIPVHIYSYTLNKSIGLPIIEYDRVSDLDIEKKISRSEGFKNAKVKAKHTAKELYKKIDKIARKYKVPKLELIEHIFESESYGLL
jgi:hypothetical protein